MSAKQLDENKVVLGQAVKVANQEQKMNENEVYLAFQVEDENGLNERCILFTEIEFSDLEKITFDFAFNKMVDGRIYSAVIDKKPTNLVKLANGEGDKKIYRISATQLKTAEERALKNPEDLTKKNFFTDLKD